jgi:hypothetical protein
MAVGQDVDASGGAYILLPSGATGGKARLQFMAPAEGGYVVWGRVLAPSDTANSFHASMDLDLVDNDPSDGASTIWDLPVTTTWRWVRVNMRVDVAGNDTNLTFLLTQGLHTLYLNGREPQSELDALIITNDPTLSPL